MTISIGGHTELTDGLNPDLPEEMELQAKRLESMLPVLMARLFRLDPDHPLAEMPLAQLRICVYLQAGPQSMSTISEEFKTSVSAVTQMADRLERGGFVERVVGSDDRRQKILRLTEYGAQVMRSRREMRVGRLLETLQKLSPEMRTTLIEAIEAFREAAADVNPVERQGYVVPQP